MAGEIYISKKLNSINIAGHFYQTGADRLVTSSGTGTTVTITDTASGTVLVKNAPYNKLVDESGTTFGASQSAVVTALNAYFTAEDPDGIVTKNDNLLKLSNIDQTITASKAGSIIVVGSGDGALTASTATVNSFLQPNTAISTSGITNTGTISSTGAITTDSFMRADYLILEGATADNFETTLTLVDPTQDNTITLPDASGTVALTSDIPNLLWTQSGNNIYYNTGNVGIGTTSPTAKLHSMGADGNTFSLRIGRADTGSEWSFNHAGDDLRIYNQGGSGKDILLSVDAAGTDKGNKVGIGTSSPSYKLDVDGGTENTVASFSSTDSVAQIRIADGDATPFYFGVVGNNAYISPTGGTPADGLTINSTGDVTYGAITTTQNGSIVRGGFMNPASEANMVHLPHIVNDLAGFQNWGTITTSGLYWTRSGTSGSYTYSNEVTASDFDNGAAFDGYSSTAGSWYSDNGVDGNTAGTGTITLEWSNELTYSAWAGIVFGANNFTATRVKIEAYRGGAWQTLCDITDNTDQVVLRQIGSNSGPGSATNKLRYTLGGSVNNGYFRIHTLYAANYRAGDNNLSGTFTDKTRGVHYLEKYKNNYVYGHFYPAETNTYNLGNSSLQWNTIYSNGGNSSQWNTAYGWGNHASAGYLTTSTGDSRYIRNDTSDYFSGKLTFNGTAGSDALDLGSSDINAVRQIHANEYHQNGSGVPRSNLGDPTVTEMALFEEQFTCKTGLNNDYDDLTDLTFWTQATSGSSWVEESVTDDKKRRFLRTNDGHIDFAYGTYKFRVEFRGKGYTFANAIYSYFSTQGHDMQVHVWKKRCSDGTWIQHTAETDTVASWPGHLWMPFNSIPWYETNTTSESHFSDIRIEFTPNWNSTYPSNAIRLSGLQVWGGYPTGRRTPHRYDQNGKLITWGDLEVSGNLDITGNTSTSAVDFDIITPPSLTDGRIAYDIDRETLVFQSEHGELAIGETYKPVYNNTGSTIAKGATVKATGVSGEKFLIELFDASSGVDEELYFIGVTQAAIPNATAGIVVSEGLVKHLDTSGYSVGTILYASETAGALTSTKPTSPNLGIPVAMVTKVDATNGTIYVRPDRYAHLNEIHDVSISSPANEHILRYNSTSGVWENVAPLWNDFTGFNFISTTNNVVVTGDLTVANLSLGVAGQSTTTIGVSIGEDLDITSKGNVTVKLDSDNNEPAQKFAVNDGAGVEVFSVDESGGLDLIGDITLSSTSDLLVGGNKYAFKYNKALGYGLYFNLTNGTYDLCTSDGSAVFEVNVTNGDTDINRDLQVGRNLDVTGYITVPQFVENETNKNDRITFDATGTTAGRVYDLSGTTVGPASATATYKLGFVEVANESMILRGLVTLQASLSGSPALGQPLYLGSSGIASVTAPSTSGDIVRVIGYYMGEEQGVGSLMYFDPSNDWVEIS